MMVSFEFLTKPISIDSGINILCIENKALYRKVLLTLINKQENYINVVFSDDYKPFDITKNIEVIYNYYKNSPIHIKMNRGIISFWHPHLQTPKRYD